MGAQQKVAIITGASQGIGEALVKAYRDRNFRVVATSRSIKPSSDPDVLAVAGDIADPKTAERVVSQAIERFGIFVVADRPQRPGETSKQFAFRGVFESALFDQGGQQIFLAVEMVDQKASAGADTFRQRPQ